MTLTSRYLAPTPTIWQGRIDSPPASCFFQTIKMLDLRNELPAHHHHLAFALLGFCCDEGIRRNFGRVGAAEGPFAIRQVLAKLPVHRSHFTCYDAGDITCSDQDLARAQEALADAVSLLLEHHIVPIVLGGGHEVAWGHFQGLAKQGLQQQLNIVNFDAHFDMRPLLPDNQGSSGTPFLQIAKSYESLDAFHYYCIGIQPTGNLVSLFDTAKNYHTHIILADDIQQNSDRMQTHFFHPLLDDNNKAIYLSLCLDVFAAACAPGVSAPQALGVTPWQLIPLIRKLAESGNVISYDIAELSPPFDIDAHTAKLAANIVSDIIHHHILRSHS